MKPRHEILIVDDEAVMRESLAAWLREDGYTTATAASGREAVELARRERYSICFVDLKMPGGIDGIATMREIRRVQPEASIIIITAFATVDTAVAAMKEGAQEYIVKPCNPAEISLLVKRIVKLRNLQRENRILRKKLYRQYSLEDIVGKSPRMLEIFKLIREISSLRSTVLIQGESGTGKELVARAIHHSGERGGRPFVGVSCAALAETLLESELFGHERGAFTGAVSLRKGKFELADGGTLFLDEIGEIPPKLQMDLLRALQERCFYRVGGSEEVRVNVRVIAATNSELSESVRQGRFREELYYRLNVINIRIPPLRERREDIPLLARYFVARLGPELGKDVDTVEDGAIRRLMKHEWPGNVRELENAIERALITCRGNSLAEEDFASLLPDRGLERDWWPPADWTLEELQLRAITAALQRHNGNIRRASAALGVDRSTLYEWIRRHHISRQGGDPADENS